MLTDYYFLTLNQNEQVAYYSIRDALVRGDESCSLNNIDVKGAENALRAVILDHPEIIQYPGLFKSIATNSTRGVCAFFYYSNVDYDLFDRKIDNLTAAIDKKLSENASDYAKCKAIYEAMAENIKYDFQTLNQYNAMVRENPSSDVKRSFVASKSDAFTPYGITTKHKGVCQGIAKLYKILCDRFGVECACVQAERKDEGRCPHLLNVVEVDGKRAFVDVTNALKTDDFPAINYDYFLIPLRIYSLDFDVIGEFECTAEDINYYRKNNLWFETVDSLRRYLSSATVPLTGGLIRCRYNGHKLDNEELEELFSYVVNSHCRDGYEALMKHIRVKNGFCTAIIKSMRE